MKHILFCLAMACCLLSGIIQISAQPPCELTITTPANDSVVQDNNQLSHQNLFSFTVKGTVKNLGNNKICVYQKVPGGNEWWRSGEPIGEDELGPDGSWSMGYASFGEKSDPHAAVNIKAVVQNTCPASGAKVKEIGESLCKTPTYTYKSKE